MGYPAGMHASRVDFGAAYLEEGRRLADVLPESSPDFGAANLPFVFNPLIVDGTRAWALFAFDTCSVWCEKYPSSSFLEFVALHDDGWKDPLLSLAAERPAIDGGGARLLEWFGRQAPAARDAFDNLCRIWLRSLLYREALLQRNLVGTATLAQAMEIYRSTPIPELGREHIAPALQAILPIATRRAERP